MKFFAAFIAVALLASEAFANPPARVFVQRQVIVQKQVVQQVRVVQPVVVQQRFVQRVRVVEPVFVQQRFVQPLYVQPLVVESLRLTDGCGSCAPAPLIIR